MLKYLKIPFLIRAACDRMRWDEAKIRDYQEKKLKRMIYYVYNNNPFYHDKFKENDINPLDIRGLDDINKLPIIGKDELRKKNVDEILSSGYSADKLRMLKTSGSTGRPLKIFISGNEDSWRKAIYLRANIFCGQRIRDKWVCVTSPGHFSDTTKIQRISNIYAQRCISVLDDISDQLSKIERIEPDILDGYSSSIYLIAREVEKRGTISINPRIVFGNAEVIDDRSIQFVEKVFGAPYYDQYGCVEFNRTAWQCPEKSGYHLDADSVITQFLDEEGNEVAPGEQGRIVETSLFNYAMPLLRYDIGDIGVPSDEKCSCGTSLPLMKSIEGRRDSLIPLPDGRLLSPRTFTISMSLFKHYNRIEQFRIVQKKINLIEIYIKKKKNDLSNETFEQDLLNHLDNLLKLSENDVLIKIFFVDQIDLNESGKIMTVVSEVSNIVTL